MITEMQARLIAHTLHEIRPRWAIASMLTMLEKNANHPAGFADTIAAAVNAARDPAVQTPGLIFIDSRFWPDDVKKRLPRPPECPDHIGKDSTNCSSCWADVKTGYRPESHIGKHFQAPADVGASAISTEET